jgi:hypothetical protein
MTAHRATATSLRLERLDSTRLIRALALSVAVHLLCWGGYTVGKKYEIWDKLTLPAWVKNLTPALFKKPEPPSPPPESEPPLVFVNVNPDTATPEPPKDAIYYSSLNSKAANPEPERDTEKPKLTGQQEFVPETETVERNNFDKLQPTLPAPEPQPEERPKPAEAPGDLAMAKPELKPSPDTGEAERERPRRLSQVKQPAGRLPSQMMKQDGGVRADLDSPSLDTKSTITGMYDALFIQSVKQRWLDLLDSRDQAAAPRGHVRLQFKLHYDGRITDMIVIEHTVTETLSLICQKAVLDPSPFDKWTREMRLLIGKEFREIKFTFYYY